MKTRSLLVLSSLGVAVDLEQDLSLGENPPAHLVGEVASPGETQ